jgi:uncharacterized protein (TIRG00374 family)
MRRWFNDWLRVLSLVAGVGALALLYRTFGLDDVVAALTRLRPLYLIACLAIGCGVRLGYSVRWWLVAAALGDAPGLPRFVAARLAGDAIGALVPTGRVGGDPLRAALLYADGVPGPRAGAGVALDRLLESVGNTLCCAAYVAAFASTHALRGWVHAPSVVAGACTLLLAALASFVALLRSGRRPLTPLLGALMPRRWVQLRGWLAVLARAEDDLVRFFRESPRGFLWGVVGSLLIEGLIIVEYHCLLAAFGVAIDLPTLLAMLVVSGLVRVTPVPAALGALEASQVLLLGAASGRPETGFVVGLVLRLHETWWTAVGLVALSAQGFSLARLRVLAIGKAAG